jgi:hypothetical protein
VSIRIVATVHTTKTDVVYEMKQDGEHTNFDPQCTLQRREAQKLNRGMETPRAATVHTTTGIATG